MTVCKKNSKDAMNLSTKQTENKSFIEALPLKKFHTITERDVTMAIKSINNYKKDKLIKTEFSFKGKINLSSIVLSLFPCFKMTNSISQRKSKIF